MGVSTDGQLCYGILLEEEGEFPWDVDEHDNDFEEWWLVGICGFKHSFELFDEKGNWIEPRQSSDVEDKYFKEQRDFEKSHKCPYTLVNVCSGDYPIYMLALEDTLISASRGTPELIKFDELRGISQEEDSDLLSFCEKYNIPYEGESGWYLSSYWG